MKIQQLFENWRDSDLMRRAQKELDLDPEDKGAQEIVNKNEFRHEDRNLYEFLSDLGFEQQFSLYDFGGTKVKQFGKNFDIVRFYLFCNTMTDLKQGIDPRTKFEKYFNGDFYDSAICVSICAKLDHPPFSKEFMRNYYELYPHSSETGVELFKTWSRNIIDAKDFIEHNVPNIPSAIKEKEKEMRQKIVSSNRYHRL